MNLKEIRILNFKGIKELEIQFKEGFNLIIGNNGVGKTSILDAISISLGGFVNGIDGVYSKHFSKDEIRRETKVLGDASYNIDYKVPVQVDSTIELNGEEYSWTRQKKSYLASRSTVEPKQISHVASQMSKDDQAILPIINYQGASRMWGGKRETIKNSPNTDDFSRNKGYVGSLVSEANNRSLINWCMKMEQISWQEDKKISEYESVKKAVATFMSKINESDVQKVIYDKKSEELMYRENGSFLPISYLSSGYQALIWLVFDIAYRMAVLNPNLRSDVIARTSGIVLIDELDVHLHPKWQWKVIEALQMTFPNVQFIATTHSPIVLASCKDANVIMINSAKEVEYRESSYGLPVNSILSVYQESDEIAVEIREKLNEFTEKLTLGKTKEAEEMLEDLKSELGENNPKITEASLELNFEKMEIEWD